MIYIIVFVLVLIAITLVFGANMGKKFLKWSIFIAISLGAIFLFIVFIKYTLPVLFVLFLLGGLISFESLMESKIGENKIYRFFIRKEKDGFWSKHR